MEELLDAASQDIELDSFFIVGVLENLQADPNVRLGNRRCTIPSQLTLYTV